MNFQILQECLNQFLKKLNLKKIVNDCLKLMKVNDDTIIIDFKCDDNILIKADSEQISRVFINLIKNSIESLNEKYQKNNEFIKKIIIEIYQINDYIEILIIDNGTGFNNTNLSEISKPYFTTKKNGSGLGLSIVVKIINDHNGTIEFLNYKKGAKIKINFSQN